MCQKGLSSPGHALFKQLPPFVPVVTVPEQKCHPSQLSPAQQGTKHLLLQPGFLKGLGTKSSVLGCVDEVWWSPPPLGGKPRGCLMQQKTPDTLTSLLRHVELPLTCPNTAGKEEPVPASPWK